MNPAEVASKSHYALSKDVGSLVGTPTRRIIGRELTKAAFFRHSFSKQGITLYI